MTPAGTKTQTSANLGEREKAALAYAKAITWRLDADDARWDRLHQHFSKPELVELGCFIALTMGQQSSQASGVGKLTVTVSAG
jgi:alkylhydroperoxidase family enzyme